MRATALHRFCADCGLAAPLELEVAGPGQAPSRHAVAQPFVVLGRSPDATLCLDDDAVSQRHAYLQVVRGHAFVIDLEGRSRLLLDDQPVAAGWIGPGQALGVGPFRLTLGGEAGVGPPEGCPLEDEVRGPERAALASFDVSIGDQLRAKWRMNRALALIGRSTRCRVRLPDPSVSRIHCAVVATAGGAWLVDLLSREGTLLRGEPVRFTRLEEGDRFDVGIYRLRIRYHQHASGVVLSPRPAPVARTTPETAPVLVLGDGPGDLPPAQTALVAADSPLVGALVQQFGLLQQHMFDQFQQTLLMMAKMMTAMHHEHAALVREEMRQFQRATDEIHELRRQMVAGAAPAPPAPPAAEAEVPAPQAAPAMPSPPPPPQAAPGPEAAPRSPGRWAPGAWPSGAPKGAPEPAPPPPVLDDGLGPTISVPAPAAAQAEAAAAEPVPEGADAVHAWLTGRIAELESERQSRWQKILGLFRAGG